MKKTAKLIGLALLLCSFNIGYCQYNALNIPEAYYGVTGSNGTTFTLNIDDTALEPTKANNYLETAVDELLNKKLVTNSFTKSSVCRIFYRGEIAKMD